MKKLLSIVLSVAVLMTLAFSAMTMSASAANAGSIMPSKAEDFEIIKGGPNQTESMTVKKTDAGFEFVSDPGGWPQACYENPTEANWVKADTNDANLYLNWDFEVKSGGANICIYFAGQSLKDQPAAGAAETLNYLIDPANNSLATNAVKDLPVGKYQGSVHVKDTGISELLMDEGIYYISGVKIFAVGGTVVVNDIWVGAKAGGDAATTPTTTTKAPDTAAPTTTVATTTGTNATTTPSSAQTGDVSNAVIFVVVAAAAAGIVVLSVVAKRKKS